MVNSKLNTYSKFYIILNISPDSVKDVNILELASLMPKERILKFNKMHDQNKKINYLFSYFLLWYALEKNKITKHAPEFFYTKNNKPFLKYTNKVFFSISHTQNAISCGISKNNIGIDIENIRNIKTNLAQKVFVPWEYSQYLQCKNKKETFFRFWTLKESFCKLNDCSIFLNCAKINSITLKNTFSFKFLNLVFAANFQDNSKFIMKNLSFNYLLNFSLQKLKLLVV